MIVPQEIRLIGQPVRSLQTMLRELSFLYDFLPRLNPDGIFGERTLEAVMLFQREFFPPVTGQVNQATWDAIAALYLQARTRLAGPLPGRTYPKGGFYRPAGAEQRPPLSGAVHVPGPGPAAGWGRIRPVTGQNDAATQRNIRWVQRLDGRPETGILDQDSWNTISRLYTLFVTYGQA